MYRKETKTTGIEMYVIECMALGLIEVEALSHLSTKGYDISPAEDDRLKAEVKDNT